MRRINNNYDIDYTRENPYGKMNNKRFGKVKEYVEYYDENGDVDYVKTNTHEYFPDMRSAKKGTNGNTSTGLAIFLFLMILGVVFVVSNIQTPNASSNGYSGGSNYVYSGESTTTASSDPLYEITIYYGTKSFTNAEDASDYQNETGIYPADTYPVYKEVGDALYVKNDNVDGWINKSDAIEKSHLQ